PEFVRRFEAEAQLVANLEHPYIVPLYDYWRDADGAFLAMRWLRGGSMKDVLQRGHWPLKDIPRVLDQITGALAVAHRNGVIHRDLKPENILLDEEKNAYLADFGIAIDTQRITDSATFIQKAEEGRLVGSPDFMAPEQIQLGDITPQTDIYALGIVLYMMLTGRKPFTGDTLGEVITQHLYNTVPNVREYRPELPEELNEIIEYATEKQPEHRYDSVTAMAMAFRRAMDDTRDTVIENLDHATIAGFDLSELEATETFTGLQDIFDHPTQSLEVEPENPYKGLRAFQEADAQDFFGRDQQVGTLLDRLNGEDRSSRFIALIGPSGSGKSSMVRAGLLPTLRHDEKWFITDMTPGSHPLEELEAALLRVAVNPPASLMEQLERDQRGLVRAAKRILPGGDDSHTELVLFIDQFEEVFTLVEDESSRTAFLDLLRATADDAGSRLRIILTMRADMYDRPLLYPEFGELVRESTEVILPLSRDELQNAIRKPADRARLKLEDGLVADIIADVSQQPGMLPLMQYALTELFERREGNLLTKAAYADIGGVTGALARRADELYESLDESHRAIARQLFLRLVTLGDGVEDTRRRAQLAELLALEKADDVQQVIDHFGKYRLLTFDHDPATRAPTVEVAHEALIRRWDQLRVWLDESRDDLRTQRRLIQAVNEWRHNSKDPGFLLTGTRLTQFEEWRAATTMTLTADEQAYLDASVARRTEQEQLEAERAAREAALEKRSRTVLRALAGVMSVAALIAVGLSLFAFDQRNAAVTSANAAATAQFESEVSENNARTLAFTAGAQAALAQSDTDLALLLGSEAAELSPESALVLQTLADVAYTPGTRRVFEGHSDRVQSVAYSADGTLAASAGDRGEVILWDVESGEEIRRFEG
ncbi:MAG: protein kinase, partial [Chloroflexota bacterium]